MNLLLEQLERTWHDGIPITAAMQIRVVSFEDPRLVIEAALEPNLNVHHTAFAGSLYAVCALAGWSALWLQLRRHGRDASILLGEGHIRYLKAVTAALRCHCDFGPDQQRALQRAVETGKGVFELESTIEVAGVAAVSFHGRYAVRV
jgi:thioesterase domain-containing protein